MEGLPRLNWKYNDYWGSTIADTPRRKSNACRDYAPKLITPAQHQFGFGTNYFGLDFQRIRLKIGLDLRIILREIRLETS